MIKFQDLGENWLESQKKPGKPIIYFRFSPKHKTRIFVRAFIPKSGQPLFSPQEAWQTAANKCFGNGTAAAGKSCPRGAFLGLGEDGLVEGIEPGSCTRSKKNKQYALKAVEILKRSPSSAIDPKQLWDLVLAGKVITHNSQMDVVLSLWGNGLIKK